MRQLCFQQFVAYNSTWYSIMPNLGRGFGEMFLFFYAPEALGSGDPLWGPYYWEHLPRPGLPSYLYMVSCSWATLTVEAYSIHSQENNKPTTVL